MRFPYDYPVREGPVKFFNILRYNYSFALIKPQQKLRLKIANTKNYRFLLPAPPPREKPPPDERRDEAELLKDVDLEEDLVEEDLPPNLEAPPPLVKPPEKIFPEEEAVLLGESIEGALPMLGRVVR